ncbi:MAG: SpoIID/LytB domain-containing protein [Oscillospiraceae bacterium]|nr:SpoIID/LytB domain-containing protein [Oscillospiraceae bacterium]
MISWNLKKIGCVLSASAMLFYVAAALPVMAAEQTTEKNWKKAKLSAYDASLSFVQYQEVDEAAAEKMQTISVGQQQKTGVLAASGTVGASDTDAAVSLATNVEPGQFAFTTYGYGHGCGLSQNGANFYATYGGYDYQSILFHYYPGTTLVQTSVPSSITAGGRTGSVLEIISMLVYNEMSSTMAPEAMKAQAVAAFTYVMNPHGDNSSLICRDNPPQNVIDAVQSVLGQALYYDGDYALTVYSASSGGYTANASDVFGVHYDYLVSVPCVYDALYDPHYGDVVYFSQEEIRNRLQSAYGIVLSNNPAVWMTLEVGGGGYIRQVNIDGQKTVSGESLRSVLGLKSGRYNYVMG